MRKIEKQLKKTKPKVAVALSGGIDSAVSAYLLQKAGYEVEGFFLKLKFKDARLAAWRESEGRASLVAGHLGIPLRIINLTENFKEEVWEPFWKDCERGLTPNPCTFCNPKIKFGLLFEKAKMLGFSSLATGHYAKITSEKGVFGLKRGTDPNKDQSYFLYRLPSKDLTHILFPLSEMRKTQVRELAKKVFPHNFFQTSESQELCFIPGKFSVFARKILPQKTGKIIDETGKELGEHEGVWFFTEGQKVGLGDVESQKSFYVLSRDVKNNQLVVTNDQFNPAFFIKQFAIKDLVLQKDQKNRTFKSSVQIRYRTAPLACQIKIQTKTKALVTLTKPIKSVTPGQSAVFYENDEVVGGGVICEKM